MKQFILKGLFGLLFTSVLFTSCKTEEVIEPETKPEFTQMTAPEQETYIKENIKMYLGHKYKLHSVTSFDADDHMSVEYPSECEQKVIITIPNSINTGDFIVQQAEDNSCALSLNDALKMDLIHYGFSNYKIGFPFFTVMNNTVIGVIEFSAHMFFYVDENQGINTDERYLELFEPRKQDIDDAQNNYGKVAAKFSKRYTFERIN